MMECMDPLRFSSQKIAEFESKIELLESKVNMLMDCIETTNITANENYRKYILDNMELNVLVSIKHILFPGNIKSRTQRKYMAGFVQAGYVESFGRSKGRMYKKVINYGYLDLDNR